MAENLWLLDVAAVDGDELACHGLSVDGYAVVLELDAGSLEGANHVERGTLLQSLDSVVVALTLAAAALTRPIGSRSDFMAARAHGDWR